MVCILAFGLYMCVYTCVLCMFVQRVGIRHYLNGGWEEGEVWGGERDVRQTTN